MNQLTLTSNTDIKQGYNHMLIQELTEPLSYINLSVQMLLGVIEDKQQLAFLEIITHSTGRIDSFINSFLTDKKL